MMSLAVTLTAFGAVAVEAGSHVRSHMAIIRVFPTSDEDLIMPDCSSPQPNGFDCHEQAADRRLPRPWQRRAYQLFDGPKHLDGAFVNVVAYLQYRRLKCRISQIPQPLGG